MLGAAWRTNLRLPDRAIGSDAEHARQAAALDPRRSVRVRSRFRTAPIAIPDHVAASRMLTEAVFNSGLRRYDAGAEAWRPEWVCYYFINDSATPSFVVDVSEHYEVKRRALACHVTQFRAASGGAVATRLTSPLFQQLVESRDAQFGALSGVAFAEGIVVKDPIVRSTLFKNPEP